MSPVRQETEPAALDRSEFTFSAGGRYGVCLRTGEAGLALETWALTSAAAVGRGVLDIGVTRRTSALPLDDGRIVLLRIDPADPARPHEVALLSPDGDRFAERRLGEIPALLGGYLLPSPGTAALAFVVARDDPEQSTIWRLSAALPGPEPVVRVPGALAGGVWLDGDGRLLAANQTSGGRRCSGVVVDLADGSWRRIWSVSDRSTDRIVLYSPRSGLLVVNSNAAGEERLGWGVLGEGNVEFPEALDGGGRVRRALAIDRSGEQVLVEEERGATSRLFTYRPADHRLRALGGPLGTVSAPASWTGELVRFRFSTPEHPPTLATVRLGTAPRWSVSRDRAPADRAAPARARLVELGGPAGPIEAIVYGGPDWRRCPHLVVALHGGPLSAWRFEFDPLFQSLAAAGVAVVAPNHRGSTGYGGEHLRAAVGRWGGPDLEDVLHLGRELERERADRLLPKPVVLGASYGAFLALLATCDEPEMWSGCVALAPFLSGPRLYDGARDAAVRNRITQLGGLQHGADAAAPRDVLRVCASMSAALLLVHGTDDLTIPVEQSRALARRLSELGRTAGDFEYLEVDGDHAHVASARQTRFRRRIVRFCRTAPERPSTHLGRR